MWQINNLNAYTVLIKEKQKDYDTEVMYSFDENFKFLKWEGCEE